MHSSTPPTTPRFLVTGASGFLGHAVVTRLLDEGHAVTAVRGQRSAPSDLSGATWVQADLTDADSVRRLMQGARETHLLALGWYMGPGNLVAQQNHDWIAASIDLIRAFAGAGGRRVVFCGTCMEYDWSGDAPLSEDAPLRPDTDYGAAKAALGTAFGPLCQGLGLSALWVRPFFLYGPGESPRRLVADVIVSILRGQPALCTHGRQIRDFLHVDDAARALAQLLLSEVEGAMNIASGTAVSLADLTTETARQLGRPDLLQLGARPAREGEAPVVRADAGRLAATGFRPAHDLETGLADTIAWWRRELKGTAR